MDALLGSSPNQEDVKNIISLIKGHEGVLGIHDLMIHDYGAQKRFGSVHVEVSGNEDIFVSHDMIDNIEREIQEKLNVQMVIHMDPIDTDDEETNEMRDYVKKMIQTIDSQLSIHDFRMVRGNTHTNLIFDCLVPHKVTLSNNEILEAIKTNIAELEKTYYVVVTFDRAYTSDIKE